MNMRAYQDFVKIKKISSEYLDSSNFVYGLNKIMPQLKKKYLRQNITDKDRIILLEERKARSQIREIDTFLEVSQVYEISDKHKFLLMMTKEPKMDDRDLWKQIRLPFPNIFIDVEFQSDEINGAESKITGIMIRELKSIDTKKNDDGNLKALSVYGLTAYITGISVEGLPFVDRFHFPIIFTEENENKKLDINYMNKKEANFIKRFILNFILFLKDREVVWINSNRTSKNRERRIKQGLIPLPNSRIVRLEGQLKRYVNSLSNSDFKGKLTHQFWISGHWRTYKNKRYNNMRGKVQWIEPFKKGEGIEVKQVRRIIPEDNPNEWNYNDIKPLNKSLRKIREENRK